MRYLALLRGINLGGKTMVKMEELRRTFEALGFENVKTYINSGNVAFDTDVGSLHVSKGSSDSVARQLVEKIEDAVERDFGRRFSVMVRPQKAIEKILANNPFDGEYGSHKEMHVLFMEREISDDQLATLREAAPAGERFIAKGREIYLHLPMGVAQSLMGRGLVEKKLKIAVTARNWRTVQKLAEL